jgi:hypothetical protein
MFPARLAPHMAESAARMKWCVWGMSESTVENASKHPKLQDYRWYLRPQNRLSDPYDLLAAMDQGTIFAGSFRRVERFVCQCDKLQTIYQ